MCLMGKMLLSLAVAVLACQSSYGVNAVVVDSLSRQPLPSASVFDKNDRLIGLCNSDGKMPYISIDSYPVTIRYLGFCEKQMDKISSDTIFLAENVFDLDEIVVESRKHNILHMLAYVREYSTLSTYTDTVFLFREKMVDYMLPYEKKLKYEGWRTPRILNSKSYYRFTNRQGLDSVSDKCNQHFSWADWIGILPQIELPQGIKSKEVSADTVFGKYSPVEIWSKKNGRLSLDIDVLADTSGRKWVPGVSLFFRNNVDYENFRVHFNYDDNDEQSVTAIDLNSLSFSIESRGRGKDMFMFNHVDEPFFVSTFAEVYIVDKEFITLKEAKKWQRNHSDFNNLPIYEAREAPELTKSVCELIERVNNVNVDEVRLASSPDRRLAGRKIEKFNVGHAILKRIKGMLGIDGVIGDRKRNKQWKQFKKGRVERSRDNAKDGEL